MYETRDDHSAGYHPTGNATVKLQRPGKHILVLSAYEPTVWHVETASGVVLNAIHFISYYTQSAIVLNSGVAIVSHSFSSGACGYSWPYNGQGCDTNQLLTLARQYTGYEIKSFHGCYRATTWTLNADMKANSNCGTNAGYQMYEWLNDKTNACSWTLTNFATADSPSCTGQRYIQFNQKYNLWVGAILCGSASRYKLYLSDASNQPFLQIADFGGHGQDHCELINSKFTIPNEDDITSGGCTTCSVGTLIDPVGIYVYARGRFGDPFQKVKSREWADLTTDWYQCGVNIP